MCTNEVRYVDKYIFQFLQIQFEIANICLKLQVASCKKRKENLPSVTSAGGRKDFFVFI